MIKVLPGGKIGILGGGQLGRMLALEARRMGYEVWVLDPVQGCPAGQVADGFIHAPFENLQAVSDLASHVDLVTLETEHIPVEALAFLETHKPVRPSSRVLRTIQDRLVQKDFLQHCNLPQAAYTGIMDRDSLTAAARTFCFPAILKSRRAGYDGKGQVRVERASDLSAAWAQINHVPAVLEAYVPFHAEISVLLARDLDGQVSCYPVAENMHRCHILHTTRVPARVSDTVQRQAEAVAETIAHTLDYCGVMAVEFFVLQDGTVLVNEIAPRTHNSGHYTFGACVTSQFEQHLRAICGLMLGDSSLLRPAVMLNLLGELWRQGTPQWEVILTHPHARLHVYGKGVARDGRKMGHVLLLDDDTDRALQLVEKMLVELHSRNTGEMHSESGGEQKTGEAEAKQQQSLRLASSFSPSDFVPGEKSRWQGKGAWLLRTFSLLYQRCVRRYGSHGFPQNSKAGL
jgi:5-(carboxyamino)imidazole ribonucleotide synthase